MIPRIVPALAQRLVDDPAAGLAFAHIGIKGGQIPAGVGLGRQGQPRALMGRFFGKVGQLVRIGFQIEQLVGSSVQRLNFHLP